MSPKVHGYHYARGRIFHISASSSVAMTAQTRIA